MFKDGAAEHLHLIQVLDDATNFAAAGLDAAFAQRPRPVMVVVHNEQAPMVAAFRQNSALRLKAGYEAEIVFAGTGRLAVLVHA